ncbi:hypothetical protein TNCV_3149641 [Trichonephila clavipes]|nr:hypothetical protein TNCV_3149641 [Trichonephila clavipes]
MDMLESLESKLRLGNCRKTQRWENVVKAPKSEGVVDPKSGERRLVSLLLSGSRGRKSAQKEIPLDAFGGSRRLTTPPRYKAWLLK